MSLAFTAPHLSPERALGLLARHYALSGTLEPLPSERDQNFRLTTAAGARYVFKIANAQEDRALLEAQQEAMARVAERHGPGPRVIPGAQGATLFECEEDGRRHLCWLVEWLPGHPLAEIGTIPPGLWHELGAGLARLDQALAGGPPSALDRDFCWNLAGAERIVSQALPTIADQELRGAMQTLRAGVRPEFFSLRRQVIHNDANDFNVLIDLPRDTSRQPARLAGFIDFGDLGVGPRVADPAIAVAYAMLGRADPLAVAGEIVAGYHRQSPLADEEFAALFGLACLRLCLSVANAQRQHRENPANDYLLISQRPIRALLPRLAEIPFRLAESRLRSACGLLPLVRRPGSPPPPPAKADLLAARRERIGPSVRLSYREPVQVVRGWMQYLFDEQGRRYLDAYNNVAHVGHCHPEVTQAAIDQLTTLNTNTRYLHEHIVRYAARLCETLPPPLEVCFFLNSASEANELALRLARAFTGARDMIVLAAAYHGHTTSLIDLSPYKHDGPGGKGAPDWVHAVPLPDGYRGEYKYDDPQAGAKYAAGVTAQVDSLRRAGRGLAGFIAESCPSVGGQIFFPPGYLAAAYQAVRQAGGVCVADEVQTGFGRLGSHFWGFQEQGVVPDLVVLGKPIGNGFPLAAVVTTRAIAERFDNGMEFFSTFGGNPVACAVGLAVLEIVLRDRLTDHARRVGERLLAGLRPLRDRFPLVGDVRGKGLFLGVELVRDRQTLEPADSEAAHLVNRLRERGILLGTDGPWHNVIKIRPPMPFDEDNADRLLAELTRILAEDFPA